MIQVSSEYFKSINAPIRKSMNFLVGLGVANTEMARNSIYSDNGHMRYSNVNGLKNLFASNKVYTTAEPNMYILDGNHEITPEKDNFQGYVSSIASGDNGVLTPIPILTIWTNKAYDLIGFTIKFDEENNDYPTKFDITYYGINGEIIKETKITNNDKTQYIDEGDIKNVSKIEIKFYETHNYGRRVRVTGITLGIYEELYSGGKEDNTIKKIRHQTEISPLSKEIPVNDFSFTISDENATYNAENPTGIWKYTKKGQIVTFKYIQELENGGTESIPGGRFYLEERPSTSGKEASFKSVSRIESLEQTYDEGTYYPIGRSYKTLFDDVFKFCGLGEGEYEIAPELAEMYTMIPLPMESAKNCIQLLCQATGKIAYEDITGKIFIKDNNETISDYSLALKQDFEFPKYEEETAEVRRIIIKKYVLNVKTDVSELAKTTVVLNGTSEIKVNYNLSTNHTYTITGGEVLEGKFYGQCCKLIIKPNSPNSLINLAISGNEIEEAEVTRIYNVNENGYDCELDFKMLSEDNVSDMLFLIYKKYLSEQKRYEISYRGNPEIRANDIIQIATRFANEINAMVLSSEIEWNNGAKGKINLKNYFSKGGETV